MIKNPGIDLKLTKLDSGIYDLSISDDGDLSGTDSFDTAILMSVFCERRASDSEVLDNKYRRGWWGNLLSDVPNFEIGSKVWLLEQVKLTNVQLNLCKTYLTNALGWLIEDNYSTSVSVDGVLTQTGIRVKIDINVLQDNIKTPSYDLWLNTGLNK